MPPTCQCHSLYLKAENLRETGQQSHTIIPHKYARVFQTNVDWTKWISTVNTN